MFKNEPRPSEDTRRRLKSVSSADIELKEGQFAIYISVENVVRIKRICEYLIERVGQFQSD